MRENTDYMKGAFVWMATFVVFACPFFVFSLFRIMDHRKVNKVTIGYDMLTDNQKASFNANLAFSVTQTFFWAVFIFNPLLRKKYIDKYGGLCPTILAIFSVVTSTVIMPLTIWIYNGANWSSEVGDSFIAVWLMTYQLINANIWVGMIILAIHKLCCSPSTNP